MAEQCVSADEAQGKLCGTVSARWWGERKYILDSAGVLTVSYMYGYACVPCFIQNPASSLY